MSVPKKYKMLVENVIRNQRKSSFVSFQNKFFIARQILKQNFHNVSDFVSKKFEISF